MSQQQQGGPGSSYFDCSEVNEICPVEATIYGDYFTRGACLFFVAAYILLLAAQGYLGWRLRSWGFVISLAAGTISEFIGYVCRTIMVSNPWNFGAFVVQSLMLVLGPTIIAAAISVTFKHLVLWYGSQWSFIRPSLYPWVFVGTDLVSLLIQMTGGGLAAIATIKLDQSLSTIGNNLMLAGVCFQVANMVFCGGLILVYAWRRFQNKATSANVRDDSARLRSGYSDLDDVPPAFVASDDKTKLRTKQFVWALAVAYVAIIIRCIYRIPEMSMGWGSELQKNETTFLILDGGMVLVSVVALTVLHPHLFFPYMSKAAKASKTTQVVPFNHQEQAVELAHLSK